MFKEKSYFWTFWTIAIALLLLVILAILINAKEINMAINWEEVNNIERESEYEPSTERRKIAPSVQDQLNKFDKIFDERNPTEEDFHQNNEKVVVRKELPYLQKALAQTLRWRSFCEASS